MERPTRSYQIQLVTPAFVAGADQQTPELRVPSIRGCLRWWFRLAQHARGATLPEIVRDEDELFGSTAKGQRLLLRVRDVKLGQAKPLGYKDLAFDQQYLWFALRPDRDGAIARPALPAETVFELRTAVPLRLVRGEELLTRLDEVVAHWVLFGGIGMRSRRCAGSLWYASRLPSGEALPAGKAGIKRLLDEKLGRLAGVLDVEIGEKVFPGWKEAMAEAGNRYRGRRGQVKDAKGPRALPVLGWPIMRFRPGKFEVDGKKSERLGSPVMLKVIPDGTGFRWMLVVVKRPFFEVVESSQGRATAGEVLDDFAGGFPGAVGRDPRDRGPRPGPPRYGRR